jgi:hypothetical protein
MEPWDIESYYGEMHIYRITFADDSGKPLNMSTTTFQSKIKNIRGTGEFSFTIDASNATNGILTVTLPIIPVGSYAFDVVMNSGNNQYNVIITGTIRIIKGVTL